MGLETQYVSYDSLTILKSLERDIYFKLNCHRIGKIEQFNPTTQTATISIIDKRIDLSTTPPTYSDFDIIQECPVLLPRGSQGGVEYPINIGDECVIYFNDRDIDNWFQSGKKQAPNTIRAHDISDSIVAVGIRSVPNFIQDYDNTRTKIFYKDSNTQYKENKIITTSQEINNLSTQGSEINITDKIEMSANLGGEINITDKIEFKNTAKDLKIILTTLINVITNILVLDTHSTQYILPIDDNSKNALTTLLADINLLLK